MRCNLLKGPRYNAVKRSVFAVDYININIEVRSFILIETIKCARESSRKLNIYKSFVVFSDIKYHCLSFRYCSRDCGVMVDRMEFGAFSRFHIPNMRSFFPDLLP